MKSLAVIAWEKFVQISNVYRGSTLCRGEVATLTDEEVVDFNNELEKAYAATRRVSELMGAAQQRFIEQQQASATKPRTRRRSNWPSVNK